MDSLRVVVIKTADGHFTDELFFFVVKVLKMAFQSLFFKLIERLAFFHRREDILPGQVAGAAQLCHFFLLTLDVPGQFLQKVQIDEELLSGGGLLLASLQLLFGAFPPGQVGAELIQGRLQVSLRFGKLFLFDLFLVLAIFAQRFQFELINHKNEVSAFRPQPVNV